MLDDSMRIDMIKDWISVWLRACSENENVKMLAQIFEDLLCIGTNANISVDYSIVDASEGHFDFVSWSDQLICVDQGLIHIKNDGFSA